MVDVNKPVENPGLVRAMENYSAAGDSAAENALLAAIQAANYLVVLDKPLEIEDVDGTGTGTVKKGTVIGIRMIEDAQGNRYNFAFTDWTELTKWSGKPASETQTLVMPFSDVAAMVLNERASCAGIIINPRSHNQFVSRELVAHMAGGLAEYTVKKDTKVMLGVPANYPHDMAEAMKKAVEPLPQVDKLYLLLMRKEDGEESFLIIVEGPGDVRGAFASIGNAARPHLPKGMPLDIVPASERFGQSAVQNQKPFYTRGQA